MAKKDLTIKYLYVVSHPYSAGWIKLGETSEPERRLGHYNGSCAFKHFAMNYCEQMTLSNIRWICDYFKKNIAHKRTEWFNISVEKAIELIKKLIIKAEIDHEVTQIGISAKSEAVDNKYALKLADEAKPKRAYTRVTNKFKNKGNKAA